MIENKNTDRLKQLVKVTLCTLAINLVIVTTINGFSIAQRNENTNNKDKLLRLNENYTYLKENGNYVITGSALNDDLAHIPNYVTNLMIDHNNYITDLSNLYIYDKCSNIKTLYIINCPGIIDLSIIKYMDNLEELYIKDCVGITEELVNYLDSKGINHNITNQDIKNSKEIDEILNKIITLDMSDEEKIKRIALYVSKNYSYDLNLSELSNVYPLTCMLVNKKGVCASYAYFTNILLRKAGINSYELVDNDHGWNLIEVDNKYYYLDVTNINKLCGLNLFSVEHFNSGFYYMIDPTAADWSCMTNYNAGPSKIIIPKSLVLEIEKGESNKNFYEKYGNSRIANDIKILLSLIGIGIAIKGCYNLGKISKKEENNVKKI